MENLTGYLLSGGSTTDDSSSRLSKRANSVDTSPRSGSLSYNTSHSSNRGETAESPQVPISSVVSPTADSPIREPREIQSLDRLVSPLTPTTHYGGIPPTFSTTSLPPAQLTPTVRKPSSTPSTATEPVPLRPRTESVASTVTSSAPSVPRKELRSRMMLGRRTASVKSKPSKPNTATPQSFAFSATGDSVLVWGGSSLGIAKLDLATSAQPDRSMWYNIPHVQFAAAGSQRSAVIASDGMVCVNLSLYDSLLTGSTASKAHHFDGSER